MFKVEHPHKVRDLQARGYSYSEMTQYLADGGGIDDQDRNGFTMLNYFTKIGDFSAVYYLRAR